jgi:site-specific DNA-methyltransferase (adenine-specific)
MSFSMPALPRNKVLVGDTRQLLQTLPADSVDCIITSPPYFGLRDYGHQAQLGLESDVTAWVTNLRDVCHQLARVLKPTGTLWLNVGDGYSAHPREGTKTKGLLLGPQRLAIALSEDGWIVRNQVIWHKPNGMPHSVGDRLSNCYETVFLLAKSQRYFFDLDAIRTASRSSNHTPTVRAAGYPPTHALPSRGHMNRNSGLGEQRAHPLGKNPGDVWSVATAGYRGGHFATFPIRLIERPLLAGCPERVCTACGQPWGRRPHEPSQALPRLGEVVPSCRCDADPAPGVVLDPFFGSGTIALAAERHGRDWIGVELNPDYAALAEERLASWRIKEAKSPPKRWSGRSPPNSTAA